MREIFYNQKKEANAAFGKFISKNYEKWVASAAADAPIMSHQLLQFKVIPHIEQDVPLFFILIDNLRYDQWKAIRDSDNYSLDHTNHQLEELMRDKKFGTIGAVALDGMGNIAAATSTGGMTNKSTEE